MLKQIRGTHTGWMLYVWNIPECNQQGTEGSGGAVRESQMVDTISNGVAAGLLSDRW